MTAAIYYHPEAYNTSGPKLMGRNAAGESFLRGYLKHSQTDAFWLQVQKQEHSALFHKALEANFINRTAHTVTGVPIFQLFVTATVPPCAHAGVATHHDRVH